MKSKRNLKILSLLLAMSLLVNSLTVSVSEAKTKVKLNKTKVTLTIGNTTGLILKNTKSKPKWSSSNKSVATVSSRGDVIARSAGKAKITAKLGKKKYTCNVTVPRQYISATSLTLKIGENREITIYGISFDDDVYWESDDEDIVSVSEDGVITGVSAGSTTVYGIINDGTGKTYKCNVTVIDNSISPTETIKPTPDSTQNCGSVSGNITYFYNNFLGNVSDTGAHVILIPLDDNRTAKNMPTLNSYVIWELSTSLNKVGNPYKVYSGQVDGVGSYTLQNIATGEYIIFIISKKTTNGSAFNDRESYKNAIKELVLPCLNTTNAEYLGEVVGYNKYFWGIITVNKNQTTIFSHDFGITYI